MPYRVDLNIPEAMWERIKPEGKAEGAGLLCGACIMRRVEALEEYAVLDASAHTCAAERAEIRERLAAYAHEVWAGWMRYQKVGEALPQSAYRKHVVCPGKYTGSTWEGKITYILREFTGLEAGYCVLGLVRVEDGA